MADFRMNELSESTEIANSDIVHLRTTGGIDKKITGDNLRGSLVNKILSITSTQTITLTTLTNDLTILGEQVADIVATFSGVLPKGKKLTIVNTSSFDLDYVVNSVTYKLIENDSITYVSDGALFLDGETYNKQFDTYIQYPFMLTPFENYGVGTWLDISARAVGYGLSTVNSGNPTIYVTREDANQDLTFDDTDLSVGFQLSGGSYDTYYVRSKETYAGDFFRVKGGNASTFNEGKQMDSSERITGTFDGGQWSNAAGVAGAFYNAGSASYQQGTGNSNGRKFGFDSNREVRTNSEETRSINRSTVFWIRTA